MRKLVFVLAVFFSVNTILEAQHLRHARNHRVVRVGVAGVGIAVGSGWFPYWGLRFGYPRYSFPAYGFGYYNNFFHAPRFATFGAISYSPESDRVGVAWSYRSRALALQAAQNYCAKSDCQPVVWAQGGCAATARSAEMKRISYGFHAYKSQAQSKALRVCQTSGAKDCEINGWMCTY